MQNDKMQQANVTEEGLHYARLNASRTAAQILAKTLAHHVRESQQEADAAEASEYKDEIRASIKQWAFQVRAAQPRPLVSRSAVHIARDAAVFGDSIFRRTCVQLPC